MTNCRLKQIYEASIITPHGLPNELIIKILKNVIPIYSDGGSIFVKWGKGEKSESTSVDISKIDFSNDGSEAVIHIKNTMTDYDLMKATEKEIESKFEEAEKELKELKKQKEHMEMMFPDKTVDWKKYGIESI